MRRRQLQGHSSTLGDVSVIVKHHRCSLAFRVYHWLLWLFLVALLLVEPFGFVWRRFVMTNYIVYGRPPADGIFTVSGSTNDEPFTDRAIVCSLFGRLYRPLQLSTLLATTTALSTVEVSVQGYRVIRREGLVLAPEVRDYYANTCDQIALTIDGILDACTALGYNVSGIEFLHIASASDDDTLTALPSTLPVLILPFYDNARAARFAVPSHDGRACMVRLSGKYTDASLSNPFLSGVGRSVRETKSAEWLGIKRGSGVWRHGWIHDPAVPKSRWYADVFGTTDALGIRRRQFDTTTGLESDCLGTTACDAAASRAYWGKDLCLVDQALWATSITLLDETRTGIFLFESERTQQTFTTYRLEVFLANLSVAMLLFRWLVALWASQRVGQSIGVGALACAHSFHVLPVVLLPRMKMILAAFWTVGYVFEGDQRTLSEAWFVMFPAIAQFALLLFSLLNLVAKLLRRRSSDALFGPTLLSLCLLHALRWPIATSGWFEMSGRVSTIVSSSRFADLTLGDLLTPRIIFQLNGAIPSVCVFKLLLLGVNLAPLALCADRTRASIGAKRCKAEEALALRLARSGGLGRSAIYVEASSTTVAPLAVRNKGLTAYELARAGYVVLGPDALVSMSDWFWFMVSAPFRSVGMPMRHLRMVTFTVSRDHPTADGEDETWSIGERPTMCRVTDERFKATGAWEISVRPLH